ncbi:MAG: hypothetical protein KAV87_67115 [Desulfobacteraceae bacterium]|nr:hypothetical protein [Desulfobacteraceae bacterium]
MLRKKNELDLWQKREIMGNNCKRLIIDKSIFAGTSNEKLCQFAKNHFLILPEVLTYECATDSEKEKRQLLLQRFTDIIRAGAYVCPSVALIVEKEAQQGCPYGDIENATETRIIRTGTSIQWTENRAEKVKENEMSLTKEFLELAIKINECRQGVSKLEPLAKCVKAARETCQKDKQYLYENYLQAIDFCLRVKDMHTTTPKERPQEWVGWHYQRLMLLYLLIFSDRKDSGMNKLEHHLQDRAYIILLCRADGLLAKDEELRLLAKVAFPHKGIFADLDEVPKEYICNYSRC